MRERYTYVLEDRVYGEEKRGTPKKELRITCIIRGSEI